MTNIEVTKTYTRADRIKSVYQYIPFEVPPRTQGITIEMRHQSFSSVIDLGLFDPIGFRGASGSERNIVMITENKATPGYLPGEIKPGTWFIFIGLHQVAREGVSVEVKVTLGKPIFPKELPRKPRGERPPRRVLKSDSGFRWAPADFHTHSVHSDGRLTIDQLSELAASRGLELLAITDHNTTSHHRHLASAASHVGINLIAGQEVTTNSGHANALGEIEWVDFRQATQQWLDDTHSRGGLLSINHPLAAPCAWTRDIPKGLQLSEVWHSSWERDNSEPIEWWEYNGKPIPIGGSDFHKIGSDGLPGDPTTWIQVSTEDFHVTQDHVLDALRAGRVAISANPQAPVVFPIGDEIAVDGGDGCTLLTPSGSEKIIRSNFETFASESGLYSLKDNSGLYQSLGYVS